MARRSPKKVSISPSPRTSRRASPRPPPSPRLSRSPSPHPVKNQRCASQPSHMTKPNVAVVVSNWRKRSLTELKDTASKIRSLNTLTPRSILSPRSGDTRSRTPSPQSRTSPGRVQFSEESSRRSSTSYKAFFGLSRRSARAKGQTQTPSPRSPRSPRSPVPPVSHARCVSQPAHLSKSNLETLGENKSVSVVMYVMLLQDQLVRKGLRITLDSPLSCARTFTMIIFNQPVERKEKLV